MQLYNANEFSPSFSAGRFLICSRLHSSHFYSRSAVTNRFSTPLFFCNYNLDYLVLRCVCLDLLRACTWPRPKEFAVTKKKEKRKVMHIGRWMECVLSLVFFFPTHTFCWEAFDFKTNTPTITSVNREPISPVGCIFFYCFQVERAHWCDVTLWVKGRKEKRNIINQRTEDGADILLHSPTLAQTLKTSKNTKNLLWKLTPSSHRNESWIYARLTCYTSHTRHTVCGFSKVTC